MIFFSSDLHLGHDKDFIWKTRGFNSVEEMNEAIVERWNSVVGHEDDAYILGDALMGNSEENIKYLDKLNGHKTIVIGNHDSPKRLVLYTSHGYSIARALYLDYNGYTFFLCHYPTDTSNNDMDKPLKARILSLCGHTHNTQPWEFTGSYNVGCDAHNCMPISINKIIQDFKEKERR